MGKKVLFVGMNLEVLSLFKTSQPFSLMHSNLIDVPKSQRVEQIEMETLYFLFHKTTFANFFEHDFFVFRNLKSDFLSRAIFSATFML